VLYPFGFGLSYANFKYSDLKLSKATVGKKESLRAVVTVANTGNFKADEVVQLYVTHEGIAEAPLSALKGFKRITLDPGATQTVPFDIGPEALTIINSTGNAEFSPGKVKIIISDSSPCNRSKTLGAAKAAEATVTLK